MKLNNQMKNSKAWIEAFIKSFTNECSENSLKNKENDRAWADPLIGFSSGNDPIYQEFKRHIGSFHWTPLEIFKQSFPELKVTQDQLTIISWVLPHTDDIKIASFSQKANAESVCIVALQGQLQKRGIIR
jgi:hypothetical protein